MHPKALSKLNRSISWHDWLEVVIVEMNMSEDRPLEPANAICDVDNREQEKSQTKYLPHH
jgi:hypothetical protein